MMDVMAARIRKRHIAERGGLDWCGRSGHPFLPPGTECEQCQILLQMFWLLWEEDETSARGGTVYAHG